MKQRSLEVNGSGNLPFVKSEGSLKSNFKILKRKANIMTGKKIKDILQTKIQYNTIYRVIQNDCQGFNHLPSTIQLRKEYVVAPMDKGISIPTNTSENF
jgi:hypothetical protein